MNIFSYYKDFISNILIELAKEDKVIDELPLYKFTVEPPRELNHGDLATNACLILSKYFKSNPLNLASRILPKIKKLDEVHSVSIKKPGFINFFLHKNFWHKQIKTILEHEENYGKSNLGKGKNINVEFVSANPTGPLHVGHLRGAVIGDSLSNILSKVGFKVTKEYYVNDAGNQIDILAKSVFLRYQEIITCEKVNIPEGFYPGEYLVPIAKKIFEIHKDELLKLDEKERLEIIKKISIEHNLSKIKNDLKQINIQMDVFTSEKKLIKDKLVIKSVNLLEKRNFIYEGILPPPKNSHNDDWEPKKQKLFKSTEFGDEVDRTIYKSDGTLTYFASDIAYHMDKLDRTKGSLINIWGADHSGYIKRMCAAVEAISGKKDELDVKTCQMVNLIKDKKVLKMSKRLGSFITLKDIVDEVGSDAVRFIMLTRRNDQPLDFDFNKVTERSRENPVFYVQYAFARASSVIQKARNLGVQISNLEDIDLSLLTHNSQINLCKFLVSWPKTLEQSATYHEPHRIAFYLIELSSIFHSLWTLGRENEEIRFFHDTNQKLTLANLALISATKLILGIGLSLLSVSCPEEM